MRGVKRLVKAKLTVVSDGGVGVGGDGERLMNIPVNMDGFVEMELGTKTLRCGVRGDVAGVGWLQRWGLLTWTLTV